MNKEQLASLMIDKFPDFDPYWPGKDQLSWLNMFNKLIDLLKGKSVTQMEVPDYLQPQVGEILAAEQIAAETKHATAERKCLWAVVLGLAPVKDGNMWSILWGPNIQEGVAAFGATPEEAIQEFEKAMKERIKPIIACPDCGEYVKKRAEFIAPNKWELECIKCGKSWEIECAL